MLVVRGYDYVPPNPIGMGMGQVVPTPTHYGIGQTTNLTIANQAGSIASAGIAVTGSILGALGTTLTVLGVTLSATVVGAAIAGLIAVGLAIAQIFKGCGQTCIEATTIANQADTILAQNVDTYTSSPIRYASMQTAALNTFDTTWAALQAACGQASLGQAGVNCISDRAEGGCKWEASQGGWNADGTYTPWGAAGSGDVCWNWFVGMRDPIANDPFVQPDPTAATASTVTDGTSTGALSSITSALSGSDDLPLLIAAALVLGVFLL